MLNAAYQALHIFPGNSWGTDITILKKNLVKKSRYDIFRCNRHLCSTQTLSSNIPFAFLTHPNMKKVQIIVDIITHIVNVQLFQN